MRIGADIGGTFTDLALVDNDGRLLRIDKELTTPERPDDAVISGIVRMLHAAGLNGSDIDHVVHGTTLFTNALIERRGARTALITTKGFRDAVEIAREHRYDMYDLFLRRPDPLAPRHWRFEVDERVLADGTVRTALRPEEVEMLIDIIREERIEAVGVCLLHAYANDTHEQEIGRMLRAELPEVAVTLSSDLVPEIREYERTSTTLANAYVQRIAEEYLDRLQSRLRAECDIAGELFVMQSSGGVCEVAEAIRFPVRAVESGPAAGALMAARYGASLNQPDLLAFDMGGTTAKACMIIAGTPAETREFEVARVHQFKRGSGLPVKVSAIELIEVGTGGGSIAWVDALGRLQVGPQSAGAAPGPASYGRGGERPTVTDADLVLGYLDPEFFLGGDMRLDITAAERAIEEHVAKPLELSLIEAAWGIHRMANESMAAAARIHAIERGRDCRHSPVVAFGGAGPVHAFGVAEAVGAPATIYPMAAGATSAIGLTAAPLTLEFAKSRIEPLQNLDWAAAEALLQELESSGREILARTVRADDISTTRYVEMRYRKQGFEVRAPLPAGILSAERATDVQSAFEQAYAEKYGHIPPNAPIEAVTWRIVVRGPLPALPLPQPAIGSSPAVAKGERAIYLPARRRHESVPVYDRGALAPGTVLQGPAVIEERESTVVINAPAKISVDAQGNVMARLRED